MERVKYDPSEYTGQIVKVLFGEAPVFNTPVTPRENTLAMFRGETPLWMPLGSESKMISPRVDPDNIARGFVFDGEEPYDRSKYGGPDMFGIPWEYVPVAQGSMVKPGKPLMEDANDWRDLIKFPDVNSWDWEGSAKANAQWFETNKDQMETITLLNGTGFERLISFMDFENAAVAVIDEDQIDAVKELTNEVLERVYFPYLENIAKYYPTVSRVCIHDDWGSQRAPFFSIDVVNDIFVPLYKKYNEKVKSLGLITEIHSCGKNDMVVTGYIDGGFETWNGMYMNDKRALFEQYGDKFIFGVDPPDISKDTNASDEDLEAAAREFCEFYIRDGKCNVIANTTSRDPRFIVDVYRISREMLNA